MPLKALLLVALFLFGSQASAKNFYRYKDENGRLVVKDYLPNEAVMTGYEVINEKGRVLEKVAPVLTGEQKEAERIRQIQLAEQQKKAQEQRRKDVQLMRQYSSIDDIERALKSKTAALKINIGIVEKHNEALDKKLADLQSNAANFERQGKVVPPYILTEVESVKKQKDANNISLQQYNEKIANIEAESEKDLIRFKELQAERLIAKTKYQHEGLGNALIYSCHSKVNCDNSWKYAQIFAHENASNKLEIVTDTLIITGLPKDESQIGLSITRLPGEDDSMQVVLEVNCHQSDDGRKLCQSDDILALKQKFVDYLSQIE